GRSCTGRQAAQAPQPFPGRDLEKTSGLLRRWHEGRGFAGTGDPRAASSLEQLTDGSVHDLASLKTFERPRRLTKHTPLRTWGLHSPPSSPPRPCVRQRCWPHRCPLPPHCSVSAPSPLETGSWSPWLPLTQCGPRSASDHSL
ncbi:unnamed protein product, partial [Gulo gulo]